MPSIVSDERVDVVLVGAGPAGLMAATVAATAGAVVWVLERLSWAGGRLGVQVQSLQGPRSMYGNSSGRDFGFHLVERATAAGAVVELSADVRRLTSLGPAGFSLSYDVREIDRSLYARAVVLATGSREPRLDFPGSSLPGVMLSGDAQTAVNLHGALPGRRALMVGSDDAGLLIAADLLGAGAEVVAVVDESPVVLGREVNAEPLRDAGVEFLTSTRVVAASGGDRVDTVTVGRVDSSLHADVRSFDVDTVCLAGPRSPRTRLSNVLGCPHSDKPVLGGLVPVHDRWMETPLPGLFVCGDVAGVENGAVALESGRLVGLRLAHLLGYRHPRAGEQERLARGRLAYLRRGSRGGMRREAKAAIAVEHRRLVSSAPTRPSMHHR